MLIKLSFEVEVGQGSGSGYWDVTVVGSEYRTISDLEYERLNKIELWFQPVSELDPVSITMEVINDPDLVNRITGIESYLSTDNLYEQILEGDEYYEAYIKPEKELHSELFSIVSSSYLGSGFGSKETNEEFIEKILELDPWTDRIADLVVKFLNRYQDHRLVRRLIRDYPQLCHMIWLGWFEDWEGYSWIDLLLDSGRQIDEIDDWSEEWNLMLYICTKEPNPVRVNAVKQLLNQGSNPNLMIGDTPIKELITELGHKEYLDLF